MRYKFWLLSLDGNRGTGYTLVRDYTKKDAYETHALIADILGIGGGKLFVKDGLVGGAFYTLGDVLSGDTILICEGYATGASIFEALGSIYPVIITFNADNMVKCASIIRTLYPEHRLIFCADDDKATEQKNRQKRRDISSQRSRQDCHRRAYQP